MVAFHALRLQKKISMPLVLQVVQQSVFQLQRPASDWYKLSHVLMQWYPKGNSSIMNSHIYSLHRQASQALLWFSESSHAKSCRVPTGLSKAGVPPRSLQVFEIIPRVRLLTGFHTSRDLVSHPFVDNPCFHVPGDSQGITKYHSNQYVSCWNQWRTDESRDVLCLSEANEKLFWWFLA